MTDRSKKITELPAASSVVPADLLLVVKDTTSTPNTHKVTAANLFANVTANTVLNGRVTLANTTTISGPVNLTNTFSVGGTVTIAANGAWVGNSSGLKGEVGSKGDKGEVGSKGEVGTKGDYGVDGSKGDKGEVGAKGDKGEVGAKGDTGATGSKGDKGEVGSKGDTGATGAKGDKGDTGTTGAKGDTGSKGEVGAKGEIGVTGTKGDKGDAISSGNVSFSNTTISASSNASLILRTTLTDPLTSPPSDNVPSELTLTNTGVVRFPNGVEFNGSTLTAANTNSLSIESYDNQSHITVDGIKAELFSNGVNITAAGDAGLAKITNSDKTWSYSANGAFSFPRNTSNATVYTDFSISLANGYVEFLAGLTSPHTAPPTAPASYKFGSDWMMVPGILRLSNTTNYITGATGSGVSVYSGADVVINANNGTQQWFFNGDGSLTLAGTLKATTINNQQTGGMITIDPDGDNLAYIKIDGYEDGGERVQISNQFPGSHGIYFYTESGSFRMHGNNFIFPDGTSQSTASVKGDKGEVGVKGDKGDTGTTGAKGDKGDLGTTGDKGDKGDLGTTGDKGDKGDLGTTGDKGDKGDLGTKGDTGTTGIKGDKGDTGTTGTSAPVSASAPGTAGEMRVDSDYIYVCIATDTWKRAALSTW